MRNEVYLSRLYKASNDHKVEPEKLASVMYSAIRKMAEINPVGDEALQIVQNRVLREAVGRQFGIGTRRRKRSLDIRVNKAVTKARKRRGPGRPKGSKNKPKADDLRLA